MMTSPGALGRLPPDLRRVLLASAALFWGAWLLYVLLGTLLNRAPGRPLYERELLFEADVPRLVLDITSADGPHYRSNVHPLFVLMANPLGRLFTRLLGGRTTTAAIVFDGLAGSLAAVVSLLLFWRMSAGNLPQALVAALVTVFSMSRVFFSSIPETYALASLSLAVTYLVFWTDVNERPLPLAAWVAAGVFSFGVTVTNFAQTLICFAVAQLGRSRHSSWHVSLHAGRLAALVVAATAVLSVLQGALYPTESFLSRSTLSGELRYLEPGLLEHGPEIAFELFRNVFILGVVGGSPSVVPGEWKQARLTFSGEWAFSAAGYAALALWIVLIFGRAGAWSRHAAFYTGLAGCVLFNLLLHAVYFERTVVIEYFIYSANFSFAVMILVVGRWLGARNRPDLWILALFLVVLALNNIAVMHRIAAYYG